MSSPTDPFASGSLTDVDGLLVGHHQRTGRGWQTGTTVILAPDGAVAAVDVRGGGPGTRETDALDHRNLVDRIHAVCLTGGSAYGLASADGVMRHLERHRLGVPVGPEPAHVVPVVPTAVIFDLGRGGVFANRPDASFGERAADRAHRSRRRPARGSVGAGTGARAGGLQGGVGMAATTVDVGDGADRRAVTVAALAVVNAAGSLVDPATGAPWVTPAVLRRPTTAERGALEATRLAALAPPPMNTTIGVVATDADLTRPETGRLAQSAHDGLARAIRPAHGLTDGDSIFGLSTGRIALARATGGLVRSGGSRVVELNAVFAAAAEVFAARLHRRHPHRPHDRRRARVRRPLPLGIPGRRQRRPPVDSCAVDVLTSPDEMRAWSRARHAEGDTVGVVPTMGALHAGHLALVDALRPDADRMVVTIFVNPLQFNQPADFDSYPRPIDDDLAVCAAAGIDAVYAPTAAVMYGPRYQTHVEPGDLADRLEGPMRPGHFRGVTTVVTKLFGAVEPDLAGFGEKDFQQLAIIRRMVADLDMGVRVVGVPIIREPDGLAMSSRNVRLTTDDRTRAVVLSQALDLGEAMWRDGEREADRVKAAVRSHIEAESRARLEYVDLVDAETLVDVDTIDAPAALLTAAWFGDVRLIDNHVLA